MKKSNAYLTGAPTPHSEVHLTLEYLLEYLLGIVMGGNGSKFTCLVIRGVHVAVFWRFLGIFWVVFGRFFAGFLVVFIKV